MCRPLLLDLLRDVAQAGRQIHLDALCEMPDEVDRRPEGVMRRKKINRPRRQREKVHPVGHIEDDVLLRQHDTLALAGRPGRKDNRREPIRIDLVFVIGSIPLREKFRALLHDIFDRHRPGNIGFAEADISFDHRELRPESLRFRVDRRTHYDIFALRSSHNIDHVRCGKLLINRYHNRSDRHQCEIGAHPLKRALADQSNVFIRIAH